MKAAKAAGIRVKLHFVCVELQNLALQSIQNRAALGGHDVLEEDARRRFARSLAKLPEADSLAD